MSNRAQNTAYHIIPHNMLNWNYMYISSDILEKILRTMKNPKICKIPRSKCAISWYPKMVGEINGKLISVKNMSPVITPKNTIVIAHDHSKPVI